MKDSGIEWIGEIPEGWEVRKIKSNFAIYAGATPKSEKTEYWDGGIPWITPADFKTTDKYASYGRKSLTSLGYDSCGTTLVPAGSIIFSKRAPVGSVVIAKNALCTNQGCLSCIPNEAVNSTYFYYCMSIFTEQFELVSAGTTFKEIAASTFASFLLPCPPLSQQNEIVNFLDKEISHVDSMLFHIRSSIEEYKKLKQAVITQAVTKGVRGERAMKDSGVEWIGEIPAEWSVQRIKTIFSIRNERNYLPLEQVNLISLYTDKGVVQHCDIEKTTGNKASNADGYKKVYPNDMIVNIILCWMGAIGRSNYAGVTSPAYDVYVPSSKIECKFYHYYFRTLGFSGDCYKNGRGIMAMRWRTYSDQFRSIKVVVPPLEEQKEIVGYLDAKCAKIDKLIAKKEQLVKELESYKKSLIYEVVTGKREV